MHRFNTRFLAAALAFAVALSATTLSAQDAPSADDREARGLFEAGREAFAAARYDRALEYFRQSYALSSRPALLYNIGQSADRLRRDQEALDAFEQYLQRVPDSAQRSTVEARIAFLRGALANHAAAGSPGPAPMPAPRTGPGPVPWVLTIGGGALAIAGAVSLVLASSNAAEVRDADTGTPWRDVESAYDASNTFAWLGGALLAGGAALAGLGIVLLLSSGGSSSDEPRAGTALSPPPLRLALLPMGLVLSGGWE